MGRARNLPEPEVGVVALAGGQRIEFREVRLGLHADDGHFVLDDQAAVACDRVGGRRRDRSRNAAGARDEVAVDRR